MRGQLSVHNNTPWLPLYEAQVRLYAEAVRTATGEPTRPVLLLV